LSSMQSRKEVTAINNKTISELKYVVVANNCTECVMYALT